MKRSRAAEIMRNCALQFDAYKFVEQTHGLKEADVFKLLDELYEKALETPDWLGKKKLKPADDKPRVPFTLQPNYWYAMQLWEHTAMHYSPIRVSRVTPLKSGHQEMEVDFFHAFYPEGVVATGLVLHLGLNFYGGGRVAESGNGAGKFPANPLRMLAGGRVKSPYFHFSKTR